MMYNHTMFFASVIICTATAARRPNIVFIFADDIGYGDLASFGHPYAQTPNLDQLAQDGTSFHQFHNTGNVCPHSRAGFMTSRNPSWFPNYTEDFGFLGAMTVTKLLHDAGYVVGHVGKWNIGRSEPTSSSYAPYGMDTVRLSPDTQRDPEGRERRRFDDAIDFIQTNQARPFYLNLWVRVSHTPVNPPPELLQHFEGLVVNTTLFVGDTRKRLLRLQQQGVDIDEAMRKYLAEVLGLDYQIGRLLNELENLNLSNETMVVFTSDNGPALDQPGSAGSLRGQKHGWYQGGVVTPFVVRWPGVVPTGVQNRLSIFSALDWLPTVCSLAQVDGIDKQMFEGEDISDIWLGKSDRSRVNPLFFRDVRSRETVAMRYQNWKLWQRRGGARGNSHRTELYDLGVDPAEDRNVAHSRPEIADAMLEKIHEWEETLPSIHVRRPNTTAPFDPTLPVVVIRPPILSTEAPAALSGSSSVPSVLMNETILPTPPTTWTGLPTSQPTQGPSMPSAENDSTPFPTES